MTAIKIKNDEFIGIIDNDKFQITLGAHHALTAHSNYYRSVLSNRYLKNKESLFLQRNYFSRFKVYLIGISFPISILSPYFHSIQHFHHIIAFSQLRSLEILYQEIAILRLDVLRKAHQCNISERPSCFLLSLRRQYHFILSLFKCTKSFLALCLNRAVKIVNSSYNPRSIQNFILS